MSGEMGLRERKRLRMYRSVSETAIALFLERGFEKVSVAQIAAAADISKPTLFRYFPAKEDLVLHRFADHEDEAARVVTAARADGTAPLAALHRDFLDGLARHDPVTGLNDDPGVLAFHDLLYGTPSLVARLYTYLERSEERLAGALAAPGPPGLPDRTAAAQMVAVRRVLAQENRRRVASGERADAVHPDAVTHADRAFAELRDGLPRYAGA